MPNALLVGFAEHIDARHLAAIHRAAVQMNAHLVLRLDAHLADDVAFARARQLVFPLWLAGGDPCPQRRHRFVAQFLRIDDRAIGRRHGNPVEVGFGQFLDRLALEHDLLAVDLSNLPDRRVVRLAARARPLRARHENPPGAVFAVDRVVRIFAKSAPGRGDVEDVVAAPFAFALLDLLGHPLQQALGRRGEHDRVDRVMTIVGDAHAVHFLSFFETPGAP